MRELDLDNWPRRETYAFYKDAESPMWGVTLQLDVTALRNLCKLQKTSYFLASMYLVAHTANHYEPMRLRIRGDKVIVHDRVHAGSTVLRQDDSFGFVYFEQHEPFTAFLQNGEQAMAHFHANRGMGGDSRDDMLHCTVLPLLDFTSFQHADGRFVNQSIPKLTFGKLKQTDHRWTQPFGIHVHHALMDGLHVSRYVEKLQANINNAQALLAV